MRQHVPAGPRAIAASITPLSAGGAHPDIDAVGSLVDFYAQSGIDALLILGTTGEGVLLSVAERQAVATAFVEAASGRVPVIVHCGAQSTRDTALLAEHAAAIGAYGVAVIAPPYYALDERSLELHFIAAAQAAASIPFYLYEFEARSGYAVPLTVVHRLRERLDNFAGIKVSDSPFDRVRPYILDGLDVLIGAEGLIHEGLRAGAAGAVSGLAAAVPELTIRAVRTALPEDSAIAGRARATLQQFPFQAALKRVLQQRGVHLGPAVRAPLRDLDAEEIQSLQRELTDPASILAQSIAVSSTSVA